MISYVTGCLVKITGSGIISQALPESEYITLIGLSHIHYSRIGIYETLIVGLSLSNTGLLQDYFRDPYPIWVTGMPPGKITFMVFIPSLEYSRYGWYDNVRV